MTKTKEIEKINMIFKNLFGHKIKKPTDTKNNDCTFHNLP